MPQVDLESLVSVCAGGSSNDRKIACETLADDNDTTDPPQPESRPDSSPTHESRPDSPPESFWLSRDEEYEWWDRNAVYERKESTKGNTNTNNSSTNLNPTSNSNSNSQRFSHNLKSKAAIIGLPKTQKASFVDAKNRRNNKPSTTRLFPKRSASVGKSGASVNEPSSPKVSCIGRVRSRSRKSSSETIKDKPVGTGRKPGFFESFCAAFRLGRRDKPAPKINSPPERDSTGTKRVESVTKARISTGSVKDASFAEPGLRRSMSEIEPPGLGGMTRFASGRRSESWGVGESEIHVAQ